MSPENAKNRYDDGNIPEIDLPRNAGITHAQASSAGEGCKNDTQNSTGITHAAIPSPYPLNITHSSMKDRVVTPAEPLPESSRPRKDGPGGA